MHKTLIQTLCAVFCAMLVPMLEGGGVMRPLGMHMAMRKASGWTNPYITDGLVTYFDNEYGVDVGNGKWKELISNTDYSATFRVPDEDGGVNVRSLITIPYEWSGEATLQFSATTSERGNDWTRKHALSLRNQGGVRVLSAYMAPDNYIYLMTNGTEKTIKYIDCAKKLITAVYANNTAKVYVDGVLQYTANDVELLVPNIIALEPTTNAVSYLKTFRALGYNRALTEEEIVLNSQVESNRFNLA